MALQDIINTFQEGKRQEVSSPSPMPVAAPVEQPTVPALQEGETEQTVVRYSDKPETLTDDEYGSLLKIYSPEDIKRFSSPYDPNSEGSFLQRLYVQGNPKPEAPDEQQYRRQVAMSNLSNSLQLLGEMFASGRGAYIRPREINNVDGINKRWQDAQNLYQERLANYNKGLYDAGTRDMLQEMADRKADRNSIYAILKDRAATDQKAAAAAADQKNKDRLFEQNQNRLAETVRHNKTMERLTAQKNEQDKDENKSSSKGQKKSTPLKLRLEGPNGHSRYYDMNVERDVAELYNTAVKKGLLIPPKQEPKTVKGMRELLIMNLGKYFEGDSSSLDNSILLNDSTPAPTGRKTIEGF